HHTTRAAGRPAYVIRTLAPDNPGGSPFCSRKPNPTVGRIKYPRAIMISRPGPRLITYPIPTHVGPFPVPVTIWPPINIDLRRLPHAAIGGQIEPHAKISQRIIKIGR